MGRSPNTYVGTGKWAFNTATGGASDLVTAPVQQGPHEVLTHGVLFEGDKFWVPFQTTVGSARVSPTSVEQTTAGDSGSFDVTFTTGVDLPGLSGYDVDLYVLYDANHDGIFTANELVASSTGPAGTAEHVELVRPADGNYQIWLHGFQVAGTPTIPLDINVIEGNDLTVTGVPAGPIAGGSTVTLHVTYAKTMTSGQTYEGELLLGPSTAPTVISVPITVHRT